MENTEYDELIKSAVALHLPEGFDWRLFKAQVFQESTFNQFAVSPSGARGLLQFMGPTWAEWSEKSGYADRGPEDPEAAIYTGACYMSHLIDAWHWPRPDTDRHALALASYNAGKRHIINAQTDSGGKSLYSEIIPHLPDVTNTIKAAQAADYVVKIFGHYFGVLTGANNE